MTPGFTFWATVSAPLIICIWLALLWAAVLLIRHLWPPRPGAYRQPLCRATILRGCRWQARHDELLPASVNITVPPRWSAQPEDVIEAMKNRVYVRDVCERCGAVIERRLDGR